MEKICLGGNEMMTLVNMGLASNSFNMKNLLFHQKNQTFQSNRVLVLDTPGPERVHLTSVRCRIIYSVLNAYSASHLVAEAKMESSLKVQHHFS